MAPRPWIPVHRALKSSGLVADGTAALGIPAAHVEGLFVNLWAELNETDHDGSLRGVSDALIERWAEWTGERGKFAAFVRARHVDPEGRVKDWDVWQHPDAHERLLAQRRQAEKRERDRKTREERDGSHAAVTPERDSNHAPVTLLTDLRTNVPSNKPTGGSSARARAEVNGPPSDHHQHRTAEQQQRQPLPAATDATTRAQLIDSIGEKLAQAGYTKDRFRFGRGKPFRRDPFWDTLTDAEQRACNDRGGVRAIWEKYRKRRGP